MACNSTIPDQDIIEIRIHNISNVQFNKIKVGGGLNQKHYEDLPPGVKSAYQTYEKAYRYAYVELEIENVKFILQPIDFFGESELTPGKYTYQIDANNSTNTYSRLDLKLVKE